MASKPSSTWKKIKWTLLVLLGVGLLLFIEHSVLSSSGPNHALFQTDTPAPPTQAPPAATRTGTPGGQPPRPTTPPPGFVASAFGGRVYCGGQQSSVWLDVPRDFSAEEGVQFYCGLWALPDAWDERGYVIFFEPAYAQMVRSIYMTFEIDPTRAQGPFMGRFAEIGSNEWFDLPTIYNEGVLRAMLEIDPSILPIFDFPGQFIIALFEEPPTPAPTPTYTNTPKPTVREPSTPEPPSPQPPTNTSPPPSPQPPTNTLPPPPPVATTPGQAPPTSAPPPTSGPPPSADQGQRSGLLLILGLLAVVVVAAGVLLFVFLSRSKKLGRQPGDGAQLVLVRGQAQPPRVALDRPVVRIGRSPKDNDIVVNDPPVSSHHAEIRSKESRHAIRDLDSTNGTFVNGERLTQLRPLHDGDRITMGNTEWQYRLGGGTESLSQT